MSRLAQHEIERVSSDEDLVGHANQLCERDGVILDRETASAIRACVNFD